MPTIAKRVALAASGTATPLVGEQYEVLTFPARIEIGIMADATGVLATVYSGSDLLGQEQPVQVGTINQQPKYPDDFQFDDVADASDRLSVLLRDTSAAARVVMLVVKITPI